MRRWLRVTVHVGVLMAGIGMLSLGVSPVSAAPRVAVVEAGATPTPTPTPAPASELQICNTAKALSALGLHTEALALIDAVRADALEKIADGESLDTSRVDACKSVRQQIAAVAAKATPTPISSPTATPVPEPDAGLIGSTWNSFVAGWVTPLVPLVTFVVGAALAAFVLARFGATVWKTSTSSTKVGRRWAGWLGAVAILVGPLLYAAIVVPSADRLAADEGNPCATPTVAPPGGGEAGGSTPAPSPDCVAPGQAHVPADWSQVWTANAGTLTAALVLLLISGLGVVLLSFVFATRQRASIVFKRGADDAAALVPELVAIMGDMTGGVALGVEVPIGPDIEGLQDSIVDQTGAKPFVAWIQTFWNLISSITPWKLDVVIETADDKKDRAAAFTLSRSGKVVVQGRVDAADPGLMFDQATGATETQRIAAILAATVVVEMSRVYQSEWRLAMHGAVDSRSVALQYVATKWHKGDGRRETARRMLATALNFDPGNRAALVAMWNYTYRDSTDRSEMAEYNRWLIHQISDEAKEAVKGGEETLERLARNELLIRLLLTQGAMARNCSAQGQSPGLDDLYRADLALALLDVGAGDEGEGGRRRKRLLARINLARLVKDCRDSRGKAGTEWSRPTVLRLSSGLPVTRADVKEIDALAAIPAPEIAYSLLCHLVRDADEDDERAAAGRGPGAQLDRDRNRAEELFTKGATAVRLRRLVSVSTSDLELRLWARRDLELAFARHSATFMRLVGGIPAPALVPAAEELYAVAKKVGMLDGYAAAACNFLAEPGASGSVYATVESLRGIQGSLTWTQLARDLHAHLVADYAYFADIQVVEDWMKAVATPPEEKSPEEKPPKDEPSAETPPADAPADEEARKGEGEGDAAGSA